MSAVVHSQRLVSPPLSPVEWASQHRNSTGLIFLDSSLPDGCNLSIVATEPVKVLTGHLPEDGDKIRTVLQHHANAQAVDLAAPTGGLFGWIGFDGRYVLGVYPKCSVYQHGTASWIEPLTTGDHALLSDPRSAIQRTPLDFRPLMTRDEFVGRVAIAKNYIAAGDIYQVNLSYPWEARWPDALEPFEFYERLRQISPAPHSAFFNLNGTQVFSASPECFLQMSGNRIQTRPIKGTRPRGVDVTTDADLSKELTTSAKERAELVMITDLMRNDLGQVCEFGSVTVAELLKLERFAQVQHLVSTVEGTLRNDVDHLAALLACFPGGSISGAPKKRALEIIHELEPHERGLYTGAIGYFGFNGESQFNIAIRTAWLRAGIIRFHTGAGIVADSDPGAEHDETLHKAAGLLSAAR